VFTTISIVARMFPSFARGTPQQKPADVLIQTYIDEIEGEITAVLLRRFGEAISQPPAMGDLAVWLAGLLIASVPVQRGKAYALGALVLDDNGNVEQVTTAGITAASLPLWQATHAYVLNDTIFDEQNGYVQQASVAGTSATTRPAFPASLGSLIQDGVALTWKNIGPQIAWSLLTGGTTTDGTVIWTNATSRASRVLELINRYGAAAQLGDTLATLGAASTAKLAEQFRAYFLRMWHGLDARDDKGNPLPSGPYDLFFDPLSRHESPRPGLQAISGSDQPPHQTAKDVGLESMLVSVNEVI
jgi:hypothetical protein